MLVDDPNKHFGFLEKSRRFKEIVDDNEYTSHHERQISDDLTSGNFEKANNRVHERIGSLNQEGQDYSRKRDHRHEKKEILKLRLENEKLEQNYQKQIQAAQRDLNQTLEKCARLESALQSTVKEKVAISGTTSSKEKDYQDLMHKHAALLQKVAIIYIVGKDGKIKHKLERKAEKAKFLGEKEG